MNKILAIVTLILSVSVINSYDCDLNVAATEFLKKENLSPFPEFEANPYKIYSEDEKKEFQAYIDKTDPVCAIKYQDDSKIKYNIKQFDTRFEAESQGWNVTHQGKCGACSNLHDLTIFLTHDLTVEARSCGFKMVWSRKNALNCMKKTIGFTDSCAQIWFDNAEHSKNECFTICMWAWITKKPNNNPDGTLNDCLQCDEDKSGTIFKYFSGRSRRNSGLISEIQRPGDTVYDLQQCYY